jgi:hypothetical protein
LGDFLKKNCNQVIRAIIRQKPKSFAQSFSADSTFFRHRYIFEFFCVSLSNFAKVHRELNERDDKKVKSLSFSDTVDWKEVAENVAGHRALHLGQQLGRPGHGRPMHGRIGPGAQRPPRQVHEQEGCPLQVLCPEHLPWHH